MNLQAVPSLHSVPRESPDDASLVQSARAGQTWAAETLFRRYADRVNGFAFRLLGRDDELDDIVQDSYAESLRNLDQLKDPQAFSSWLYSIVATQVRQVLRRRRMLDRLGLRKTVALDHDIPVAANASAEVATELKLIFTVVQKMPAEVRMVFIMRKLEDMTLQEIADVMKISLRTVKRKSAQADDIVARFVAKQGAA